jgi:hypothetical protein
VKEPCKIIMHTVGRGTHSGRPSYHVECVPCCAVLHPETTGPQYCINEHIAQRYGAALELTEEQLDLVEDALGAKLYEDAPQHLRNQGFALEPGEDGEIDPDDEEQAAYARTYPQVKALEALIADAKRTRRGLRGEDQGEDRLPG